MQYKLNIAISIILILNYAYQLHLEGKDNYKHDYKLDVICGFE